MRCNHYVLIAAFVTMLTPRFSWASTVVAYYTQSAVYIGADSKAFRQPGNRPVYICKLNIANGFVFTSTGVSVGFAGPALRGAVSFDDGVNALRTRVARELASVVPGMLADGVPAYTLWDSLLIAGQGASGERLTILTVGLHRFGRSAMHPILCRQTDAVNCVNGEILRMGHIGRINQILNSPQGAYLVAKIGAAGAIHYLIEQEELATPQYVGGLISIVRVDQRGIKWINRGMCK